MADENPYVAPAADMSISIAPRKVPMEVLKEIKSAWVAALISAGITLVFTVIAMSGTAQMGFSAWELIDVALILGFAFGIYKKSRTCAVLMFIYFIISKVIFMVETGALASIPMALVFGYFFWQGIAGTFAYHKIIKG